MTSEFEKPSERATIVDQRGHHTDDLINLLAKRAMNDRQASIDNAGKKSSLDLRINGYGHGKTDSRYNLNINHRKCSELRSVSYQTLDNYLIIISDGTNCSIFEIELKIGNI